MNPVYLDNAATTPLDASVYEAMKPYFEIQYGNPSSLYQTGRETRKAVDEARKKTAAAINCLPNELYFTSGGTESDNWALKGAAFANRAKGNHIITSAVEHHAVMHTLAWLEKQGFEVSYLPVDEEGRISPESVKNAITDQTILISVMMANNEIGTLEPIAQIGALAREHKILFHTDAVQAVGAVPVDVKALNVDMLSLSAHKFHGPKGIGALYIRSGARVDPLLHGGAQERSRRAGTENVALIVGLGAAIESACQKREENALKISALRDYMIAEVLSRIPETRLNGDPHNRLPNNLNISIRYIEGEALLLRLDMLGIAASTGSACASGALDPSHVLLAIGLTHEIAHGSVRFTLSASTTKEEIDWTLKQLCEIVKSLRAMSPLYEGKE